MIKTKFLQNCFGVSIVVLSLGFFFHSIQTVSASTNPEKVFQAGQSKIGKYMLATSHLKDGEATCIILDTETGKTVYYESSGAWHLGASQLPEEPF